MRSTGYTIPGIQTLHTLRSETLVALEYDNETNTIKVMKEGKQNQILH